MYIKSTVRVNQGAVVIAQTKIEMLPGKSLSYDWSGFTVDIPPGAIPDDGVPVTMNIQASLNGKFQFPDDRVLVSGVYRISLHPPVKFAQKVTVHIQHCGSADSALSFVTTKHTQKSLPYTFEYLSGGSFSEGSIGTIKVDHFCEVAIVGQEKSKYAIHTYYIPKGVNIYVAHITVTTRLELAIQVCNIIFMYPVAKLYSIFPTAYDQALC